MLTIELLHVGALMLHLSLQVSTATASIAPCFVDDILTVLREDIGREGELVNSSLSLFGMCSGSDPSPSVLLKLSEDVRRNQRTGPEPEVLHPSAARVSEEAEGGVVLTFDLPSSPLLKKDSVLLLVLDSPLTGRNLDLAFSSGSLQPQQQSVCVSEETQYILLTGRPSTDDSLQKWRISASTKSSINKEALNDLFGGGNNISVTPLLLFSAQTGMSSRPTPVSASSLQTSFLCELKRFLDSVVPQVAVASSPVQLDFLQSLPPLRLDSSSSEALLSGMINSSTVTIFSFKNWGTVFPAQHGELSLSAALLEELRQRLAETSVQIMQTIQEENVSDRAVERLQRLRELSELQEKKTATGERQFFAFLLLKALQTVVHTYDMKRRTRTTRAHSVCDLGSLTVALDKFVLSPNTANINNCQGLCTFPLTNTKNHAVLLNNHIERGHVSERAPCCVPVAYEGLSVMDLDDQGPYVSFEPDVIAKECGCR
ncbi:muellerian-inhibiting factor [Gouania willdenowi]|uniref:TGF-beta family profile domain-containing protein n=1 Tax=Gouania willdenowi TaxID=441366 RepID=A0A8C5GZA9_GOUWI|nr:muellerian-inhibiting factor [Gouania willdenowi]